MNKELKQKIKKIISDYQDGAIPMHRLIELGKIEEDESTVDAVLTKMKRNGEIYEHPIGGYEIEHGDD